MRQKCLVVLIHPDTLILLLVQLHQQMCHMAVEVVVVGLSVLKQLPPLAAPS